MKSKVKKKPIRRIFLLILGISLIANIYLIKENNKMMEDYQLYQTNLKNIEKDKNAALVINEEDPIELEIFPEASLNEKLNDFNKCMNSPIPKDKLNSNLNNKIKEVNDIFASSPMNFAFFYQDINSGFNLSYNATQETYAASSTKAALAVYIYEMAKEGKIDLNKKRTNDAKFKWGGSGILKNESVGKEYTLRELTKLMIIYSDNTATKILQDELGMKNIRNYWKEKGVTSLYNGVDFCGMINASDGRKYMLGLYEFYIANKETLGTELLSYFISAQDKLLTQGITDYKTGHKYGDTQEYINDLAIVLSPNPYVLSVLSKRGLNDYKDFFKDIGEKFDEINKLYNSYKIEYCTNYLN